MQPRAFLSHAPSKAQAGGPSSLAAVSFPALDLDRSWTGEATEVLGTLTRKVVSLCNDSSGLSWCSVALCFLFSLSFLTRLGKFSPGSVGVVLFLELYFSFALLTSHTQLYGSFGWQSVFLFFYVLCLL